VLACSAEEAPEDRPTEGTFKTLSYNVHGLPSQLTGDDTPGRMALIAPKLNDYDIVALQEDFADDNHAILVAKADHLTEIRFNELVDPDRFYGSGLGMLAAIWTTLAIV
jgi:hypothetical protein